MTLLDTGYLAGLLLFSLLLPLMLSLQPPPQLARRRSFTRTVWIGQALLGIAGVIVLASSVAAPFAMVLGVLSCGACVVFLHRQVRSAQAENSVC